MSDRKNKQTELPSLEDLGKKIVNAHSVEAEPETSRDTVSPVRIGTELAAGVIVGIFVGYFLDKFFGTKPVFFLIFFVLGTIAGGLNIYRLATSDSSSDSFKK